MFSDNVAIRVENLSKCYHIYDRPQDRLKQSILPKLRSLTGRAPSRYYREFWALNDVSIEIARGETVGIIGRNGSGKSTLLQMICGTLEPTTGMVETRGRVAALLELGAGFNPEFTGRENVYMNATVLGLKQEEIHARFDDIASFADIGDFIEQPVKHYSSGMYARLAFSVAINVDPDILVVDEALSVGDEPFQRKCFARIEKIRKDGGTILFVSHSGSTVINLCDRAILLHRGERLYTGVPKRAVFFSQKLGNSLEGNPAAILREIEYADSEEHEAGGSTNLDQLSLNQITRLADNTIEPRTSEKDFKSSAKEFFDNNSISKSVHSYAEDGASIQNSCLLTEENVSVNQIFRGRRYKLQCDIVFDRDCPGVRVYALIRTTAGIDLAGCAYPQLGDPAFDMSNGSRFRFEFPFDCYLNPATFFCNFAVQGEDGSLHHRIVDAIAFRVSEDSPSPATGIVDLGFNPLSYQIDT
ncbi:MAG: ABC transporter ATP-binding protein [Methylotenera sp.]